MPSMMKIELWYAVETLRLEEFRLKRLQRELDAERALNRHGVADSSTVKPRLDSVIAGIVTLEKHGEGPTLIIDLNKD